MVDWTDIHKDFGEKIYDNGLKTRQQLWEEAEVTTYLEVKQWIQANFKPDDYHEVKRWKDHNFTPQEANSWTDIGFMPENYDEVNQWKNQGFTFEQTKPWIEADLKVYEINFVLYLKQNNHQPTQLSTDELFQLRKKFYPGYPNTQEWLKQNYSLEKREKTKELNLRNLNLESDLDLGKFPRHSRIYVSGNPRLGEIKNRPKWTKIVYQKPQEWLNYQHSNKNQAEKINLDHFLDFEQAGELVVDSYPKLKEIDDINSWSSASKLTKIAISNCPQLEKTNISRFEVDQELILCSLPSLKKLGFSGSQLPSLNLTNCPDLEIINCSKNKLITLDLTDCLSLKELNLSDNNLSQDLSTFRRLVNLKKMDLRNNHFTGSLESLKNMNELEALDISNTDIGGGLEYLPDNVKDFRCSTDKRPEAKVKVIEEELRKFGRNFPDNFKNWKLSRQEKQDKEEELQKAEERRVITLLIPVEKLDTARRDIKKFCDNWNKEKLAKLKDNQQLKRYQWIIGSIQWTGRVASVAGGTLLLVGTQNDDANYTTAGGAIAIIAPFIEVITSQLEKSLYESNKNKWEEFTKAADKLWDTYWELEDILKKIKEGSIKGKVKEILGNLKKEINGFLQEYDTDKNNKIDEEEREEAKRKLAQDLKDNWAKKKKQLKNIERTTEELCKEVISYRDDIDEVVDQVAEVESQLEQVVINLEEHFKADQSLNSSQAKLLDKSKKGNEEIIKLEQIQPEQQAQIQQTNLPYGTPGSSK